MKWMIETSESFDSLFRNLRVVPKKDRGWLLARIEEALSTEPNKKTKSRKPIVTQREPIFPGRDVWQLSVLDYRVFYEIFPEGRIVILFFIGEKLGTGTTAEMYRRTMEMEE